jgi:hypothetical protein
VSDGDEPGHAGEIAHASLRGAIAAMAMTGMRAFTVDLGIVEQTPPQAIFKQRARGLIRRVDEAALVRAFGLKQARRLRAAERAAIAADHLLCGLVLSEIRARPQESGR